MIIGPSASHHRWPSLDQLEVDDHVNNPQYVDLVEAATLRAAATDHAHAAKWGLVLRVYWAGDEGPEVFDRLLLAEPLLGQSEVAQHVAQSLSDHGYIAL
ncbi:MAG TPA: hypothetical protein VMV92_35125 [Streptosporangiaceae bacterium]|nr:hypothetical protein [Streptosporangiaceae bacterium]